MRSILALLLVAGAVWVGYNFVGHGSGGSAFEVLYMHLMPAPLEIGHGDASHYMLPLPLPDFLAGFANNRAAVAEGAAPVAAFTNLQLFQVLAVLLIVVCFSGVATYVRSGKGDWISRLFSGWVMWVRDEMVYPVMGKDLGSKFLPYFLSVFFFIAFMNILGLVPGSATATASIFVTGALALTTLFAMVFCGMGVQGPVAFWKNLVPHVPLAIWPLMFAVEVFGLFVKPIALTIRLFANMTGGHLVVLSFMGLIFAMGAMAPAAGYASAPVAVAFAVFIMIIEAFVALLQAYIFTQLSIIFVNASVHPEH